MTDQATAWDRIRMRIDRHRLAIVLAVVVLVVVGGGMTYLAYGSTPTETESQVVDSWETSGTLEHGATVTNESTLYANGTRLEDEPVYFTAIAPVFDVSIGGTYLGADAENVSATLTVDLVSRSVEDETTYWEDRTTLERTSVAGLSPGTPIFVNASIPIAETRDRIQQIESELDAQPGETQVYLAIEWHLTGTIEGHRQDRTIRDRLVIHTGEGTYRIDESLQLDRSITIEEAVPVTAPAGPWQRFGGPGLLFLGVVGVVGLARTRSLSEEEQTLLAHRIDRARYDEVIVTAALPAETHRHSATVESLGDLARLAIDLESVVIYDPTSGTYQTITADIRYVFDPPSESTDESAPADTSPEGEALAGDTVDH